MTTMISIIIPFYNGNQFLKRLFVSINSVATKFYEQIAFEAIIVNDSPNVDVVIPQIDKLNFEINIANNINNIGIHGSRIHGVELAKGDWIIFLDQDDELIVEGFDNQLKLTSGNDVIVGNGLYQRDKTKVLIYKNINLMKHYIQKRNFIEIRNLIPSPGECLIRKDAISKIWMSSRLFNNGSDDWLLWILLFFENRKFACNISKVYIHNDADGNNLSYDLNKMKKSSDEMFEILEMNRCLSDKELKKLRRAIDFKFYQDTKKLNLYLAIKYSDVIFENIKFKMIKFFC